MFGRLFTRKKKFYGLNEVDEICRQNIALRLYKRNARVSARGQHAAHLRLRAERDNLRSERDALKTEVEQLRSQLGFRPRAA